MPSKWLYGLHAQCFIYMPFKNASVDMHLRNHYTFIVSPCCREYVSLSRGLYDRDKLSSLPITSQRDLSNASCWNKCMLCARQCRIARCNCHSRTLMRMCFLVTKSSIWQLRFRSGHPHIAVGGARRMKMEVRTMHYPESEDKGIRGWREHTGNVTKQ